MPTNVKNNTYFPRIKKFMAINNIETHTQSTCPHTEAFIITVGEIDVIKKAFAQ